MGDRPLRILVCGGRDYDAMPSGLLKGTPDWYAAMLARAMRINALWSALAAYEERIEVVMHGNARGADALADEWARERGIPVMRFPADWKAHGRAAGPMRNWRMLSEGKPDLVIAAPGGRGTRDMIAKARAAGVKVEEIVVDG